MKPTELINFHRTYHQLEKFWVYCIAAAGKNADVQAKKVNNMYEEFETLYNHSSFVSYLFDTDTIQRHKLGQYHRIKHALYDSLNVNLKYASCEELENVHGVGPKTARLFMLFSRENARVAVLDTHILKWMRMHGINVPEQSTPQNPKRYAELEQTALKLMNSQFYDTYPLAYIDLTIWAFISGRFNELPFIQWNIN